MATNGKYNARALKFQYGVPHTLQETAELFGITRERVRQIEKRALNKIRETLLTKYGYKSMSDMLES